MPQQRKVIVTVERGQQEQEKTIVIGTFDDTKATEVKNKLDGGKTFTIKDVKTEKVPEHD